MAEDIVWEILRGSQLGFKFRREHSIGPYRLDFYCREALLGVEMDGEQHDKIADAQRDEALAMLGIFVHRIPNLRFFGLDEAPYRNEIEDIRNLCEERSGRKSFPD